MIISHNKEGSLGRSEATAHPNYHTESPRTDSNSCGIPKADLDEPIAIVGFSLKFPGEADSPEAFWDMLCNGRCASTEFPPERLNVDGFYQKTDTTSSNLYVEGGHFIKESLSVFDAPFFTITTAEAQAMDPQQRILLETTYRALENASITMEDYMGSQTSVYTASFTDDYKSIVLADAEQIPKYAATGLSAAMLANRISWFFDLHGPSVNLDSACSSSLSALHIACQDLCHGISNMALVGGSNLVFHPHIMKTMTNMSFLSPDRRCWSFDHKANGYARGDGCGVLVLKRLSDAIRHNDPIRALIRATGVNSDGRTDGGITQPSGDAQMKLIRNTFQTSKLDMSKVRYFEAHGTGTPVGDPIEGDAIGNCFRDYRSTSEPLIVGSVKSNIGHIEGASGIAGVIKCILILETGIIPPIAGFERANTSIDTGSLRIKFPTECMVWPAPGLRRACVNSFGFGGTNGFVIMDDAYHFLAEHTFGYRHELTKTVSSKITNPQLLLWSAYDEPSLRTMLQNYSHFLEKSLDKHDKRILEDIAYTLQRRNQLKWRSFAILPPQSDSPLHGLAPQSIKRSSKARRLAFVFTGQGAQYNRMGIDLMRFAPFKECIDRLDHVLKKHGCQWSLNDMLENTDVNLNEPELSQTTMTALQIGLCHLWKHFGIFPRVVVGHSSGEIAAAYCAGIISENTAIAIAYHRGICASQLIASKDIAQGMLAVAASAEMVEPYLDRIREENHQCDIDIACVNSPKSITLSGRVDQLYLLELRLKKDQLFTRKLRVNVAYHSRFTKLIDDEYLNRLHDLDWMPRVAEEIVMVSSVTGEVVPASEVCRSDYWVKNMTSQVKFSQAISKICLRAHQKVPRQIGPHTQSMVGVTDFLELGSHSTLQGPIMDIVSEHGSKQNFVYHATLNRNILAHYNVLNVTGRLWVEGFAIASEYINNTENEPRAALPHLPEYPFNHNRSYWHESRISKAFRTRKIRNHELLGSRRPGSTSLEASWINYLTIDSISWIREHEIGGACILPGAAMIVMAIEATRQLNSNNDIIVTADLREIEFLNALQLPDITNPVEIELHLSKSTGNGSEPSWYSFRLMSSDDNLTIEHCRGSTRLTMSSSRSVQEAEESKAGKKTYLEDIKAWTEKCYLQASEADVYQNVQQNGVVYGPAFQTLSSVRFDGSGTAIVDIQGLAGLSDGIDHYAIHPTILDGLFQLVFPALHDGGVFWLPATVPRRVRRLTLYCASAQDSKLHAGTKASFLGHWGTTSDVIAMNQSGSLAVIMEGSEAVFVSKLDNHSGQSPEDRALLSRVIWQPDVELLNSSNANLCLRDGELHSRTSATLSLKEYITYLVHKSPDLDILEIVQSNERQDEYCFQMFPADEGPTWSCYDFVTPSQAHHDYAQTAAHSLASIVDFQICETESQEFVTNKLYDVVIEIDVCYSLDRLKTSMKKFRKSLKPGGRYIGTLPGPEFSAVSGSSVLLPIHEMIGTFCKENDYALLDMLLADTIFVVSAVSTIPDCIIAPKEVVIVCNVENQSQIAFATELQAWITTHFRTTVVLSGLIEAAAISTNSNRIMVSLLDLENRVFGSIDLETFDALKALIVCTDKLLWISNDNINTPEPYLHIVDGLLRVARSEYTNKRLITLKGQSSSNVFFRGVLQIMTKLMQNNLNDLDDLEVEYRWHSDCLQISRIKHSANMNKTIALATAVQQILPVSLHGDIALTAEIAQYGSVNTLQYRESNDAINGVENDEVLIQVHAIGLTDRDNFAISGQIQDSRAFFQCSGIVLHSGNSSIFNVGDHVMVMNEHCFRTILRCSVSTVIPVPLSVALHAAATLPIPLLTAYYALVHIAKIAEHETILIYHAASTYGQAILHLAQYIGAKIFATYRDEEEHQFLARTYLLPEPNLIYSADRHLAHTCFKANGSKGVDVTINFTNDEEMQTSTEALGFLGRLIDLHSYRRNNAVMLGKIGVTKGITYTICDLLLVRQINPSLIQQLCKDISTLLRQGHLSPLHNQKNYPANEASKALQFINLNPFGAPVAVDLSPGQTITAQRSSTRGLIFSSAATYVVAGGFGGIGRSILRWMVKRGARYIIVLSRSGVESLAAKKLVEELRASGAHVEAPSCDIADAKGLRDALIQCSDTLPPIQGCIQCTMVLRDSVLENISHHDFISSLAPKVAGSWNLHEILPSNMDFFILMSSISCIIGTPGQGSYAAANVFEDELARYRVRRGKKAISINLGMMVSDGVVAETDGMLDSLRRLGYLMEINQDELFALLEHYCNPELQISDVDQAQIIVGIERPSIMKAKGFDPPDWMQRPLFRHFSQENKSAFIDNKNEDLGSILNGADSQEVAADIIVRMLLVKLEQVLGVPADSIDTSSSLQATGINSLTAVELKNWFARKTAADITVFQIVGNMSLLELASYAAQQRANSGPQQT